MSNTIENQKIFKAYEKIRLDEAKKGVRRKLQLLDDSIDDYMDYIKAEIDKLDENPVYQRQMYQLLADTTKEHSEFLMALKRVASSLDSGAMVIPKSKPFSKPNNGGGPIDGQEPEGEEEPEPQEQALHEKFYAMMKDDLTGHIKGAKGWLDDIQKMVEYGNKKGAMETYKGLMKNLKLMEKFLK